jgi:hypothetical protein
VHERECGQTVDGEERNEHGDPIPDATSSMQENLKQREEQLAAELERFRRHKELEQQIQRAEWKQLVLRSVTARDQFRAKDAECSVTEQRYVSMPSHLFPCRNEEGETLALSVLA